MTRFTCWGSVRGDCGHVHRTAAAAQRCCDRDDRDCRRGCPPDGYSDRHVRELRDRDELASYDVTRGPGRRPEEVFSA